MNNESHCNSVGNDLFNRTDKQHRGHVLSVKSTYRRGLVSAPYCNPHSTIPVSDIKNRDLRSERRAEASDSLRDITHTVCTVYVRASAYTTSEHSGDYVERQGGGRRGEN